MRAEIHEVLCGRCVSIFPLTGPKVSVGRNENSNICSLSTWASRDHAFFEWIDRRWFLVDNKSRNGTYLNQRKISPCTPVALKNGAEISLGPTHRTVGKYHFWWSSTFSRRSSRGEPRANRLRCKGRGCKRNIEAFGPDEDDDGRSSPDLSLPLIERLAHRHSKISNTSPYSYFRDRRHFRLGIDENSSSSSASEACGEPPGRRVQYSDQGEHLSGPPTEIGEDENSSSSSSSEEVCGGPPRRRVQHSYRGGRLSSPDTEIGEHFGQSSMNQPSTSRQGGASTFTTREDFSQLNQSYEQEMNCDGAAGHLGQSSMDQPGTSSQGGTLISVANENLVQCNQSAEQERESDEAVRPKTSFSTRKRRKMPQKRLLQNSFSDEDSNDGRLSVQFDNHVRDLRRLEERYRQEVAQREEIISNAFIEALDYNFSCPICHQVFVRAKTLGCGHTFCMNCLFIWKDRSTFCPVCRQRIVSYNNNIIVNDSIDYFVDRIGSTYAERRRMTVEEHLALNLVDNYPPGREDDDVQILD